MAEWVDAGRWIQRAPPGTMVHATVDIGRGPEVALLIREESRLIRGLGPGPRSELRTALFVEEGVAVIPVLLGLGRNPRAPELYETWVNVHAPGGLECIATLVQQDRIAVALFGESGRERGLDLPNGLRSSFADMLAAVRELPPWDMAAFEAARQRVYARLSTVGLLWDALRQ